MAGMLGPHTGHAVCITVAACAGRASMFFRGQSTTDAATRSDARHQAEIKAWWRDWYRYLTAQLQLLDARQAEATSPPSFERTEQAWEQQRAQAEQTLKRIPHDRRGIFDRTRDARRAEVQAQLDAKHQSNGSSRNLALDPDVVERETLRSLLEQAQGEGTAEDRWGAVPMPQGWYELQVGALLHAPAAAEYSVTLDDVDERRRRWLMITALILAGLIGVWWTWPRRPATAAAGSASGAIQVNGHAIQPWPVVGVTLIAGNGTRTTLPVTPTDALDWPTTTGRGAWWRTRTAASLELCVPAAALTDARTVDVESSGDAPLRSYVLQANMPPRPDLLVDPCTADPHVAPRAGTLQAVTPRSDQPLDKPVKVGVQGADVRVESAQVLGVGQDPQLPPDTYRVVVRVMASPAIDWTALDPHLLLQTGLDSIPSAPVAPVATREMRSIEYLVPAFSSSIDAAWYITDPDTRTQLRWRLKLESPRSRGDVLRDSLDVTVTGERASGTQNGTIRLALRNISSSPVVLHNDDVTVTQRDRVVPGTSLSAASVSVAPGEARTLELPLRGIDWTQTVSVRLGSAHFQLHFSS
jgi:hypothetical protein